LGTGASHVHVPSAHTDPAAVTTVLSSDWSCSPVLLGTDSVCHRGSGATTAGPDALGWAHATAAITRVTNVAVLLLIAPRF
jgi:hypothetical protein